MILTAPLLVLGIGDVIMQRHEVANFNEEFGYVVALKRAPCSSGTNLGPCFNEVVEYAVDATHKNTPGPYSCSMTRRNPVRRQLCRVRARPIAVSRGWC